MAISSITALTAPRRGPAFLVEEGVGSACAVTAGERLIVGRRDPMRADYGGATRVYVHNLCLG